MSGLDDLDFKQTLAKLSEYIDKNPNSLKQTFLLKHCNHWVNLAEPTRNFELIFHSKKMLADLLIELRKVDKAQEIYLELVKYTEKSDKYKEKLVI